MHGGAGGDGLPAGEAALAVGNDRGVAGRDRDGVGCDAELLGADLRQCGPDPLPHRHGAGVDRDAPGAADAYDARLERSAAGALYAVADPDAEIASFGSRMVLPLGKAGMVDRLERDALAAQEVAAVERDR